MCLRSAFEITTAGGSVIENLPRFTKGGNVTELSRTTTTVESAASVVVATTLAQKHPTSRNLSWFPLEQMVHLLHRQHHHHALPL